MVLEGRPAHWGAGRARPADGLPPHNVASEEAVIAALLLDGEQCQEEGVFGLLGGSDFFREENGWAFEAARSVASRGETITAITVAHELDRGRVQWTPESGWGVYLLEIAAKYFTAVGVSAHARIVAADSLYRRLIAAAGQIAQIAYEGTPGGVDLVLETAEGLLRGIREGHTNVLPAAHRFRGGVSLDVAER